MIHDEHQQPDRTASDYLGLVARGFCMGAADIVPGVSGGTMAFILGIYEELIDAIKSVDRRLILTLSRLRFKDAAHILPWRFLLALGSGIVLAILSLARILETQLELHPSRVWAFFFGLVLASVVTVSRTVRHWNLVAVCAMLLTLAIGYLLAGAVPVHTPETPWYLLLSGALAICAMILPGISGAFILVLLGKYQFILAAINNRDIITIALVAAGAALGLVSFARIISWLFTKHHDTTVSALTGLMLGSLRKIWPWKATQATSIDPHANIMAHAPANVFPSVFDHELGLTIGVALIGFVVILVIARLAQRRSN